MKCYEDPSALAEFIIILITNSTGGVLGILSVICVASNTSMDKSFRSILLSFSIANVAGMVMLTYETVMLVCFSKEMNFIMTISVLLSLCHLIMLMVALYITIEARRNRGAKDFTGLIVISWIISVTIGTVNVITDNEARLAFAFMILALVVVLSSGYSILIIKHRRKKKLKSAYQKTFLRRRIDKKKFMKSNLLILFAIIVFSYCTFSCIWVINELRSGLYDDENALIHSALLIVYSLNFYFPSTICIYLGYRHWTSKKSRGHKRSWYSDSRMSYRYRDVY